MSGATGAPPACQVRTATHEDVAAVVSAVTSLLVELGALSPPAPEEISQVAQALIENPDAGVLLLAEADGHIVGVLSASRQVALHVPGPYLLIQDLWVDPRQRGQRVGGALVQELERTARSQGMDRIEVGLPTDRFEALARTQAFYAASGFEHVGPRMRRRWQ